jgi:hypothetical protein
MGFHNDPSRSMPVQLFPIQTSDYRTEIDLNIT